MDGDHVQPNGQWWNNRVSRSTEWTVMKQPSIYSEYHVQPNGQWWNNHLFSEYHVQPNWQWCLDSHRWVCKYNTRVQRPCKTFKEKIYPSPPSFPSFLFLFPFSHMICSSLLSIPSINLRNINICPLQFPNCRFFKSHTIRILLSTIHVYLPLGNSFLGFTLTNFLLGADPFREFLFHFALDGTSDPLEVVNLTNHPGNPIN